MNCSTDLIQKKSEDVATPFLDSCSKPVPSPDTGAGMTGGGLSYISIYHFCPFTEQSLRDPLY